MERMIETAAREGLVLDTERLLKDASEAEFLASVSLARGLQVESEALEAYAECCRILAMHVG
jgi:hypothetical protein